MLTSKIRSRMVTIVVTLAASVAAGAARPKPAVEVVVRTDRPAAIYKCGERAAFKISVVEQGQALASGKAAVTITLDGGKLIEKKTVDLGPAPVEVEGSLAEPGFLRCTATFSKDGKQYRGYAGAGFDPERIQPTAVMPADFDEFWRAGRKRLEAIPLDLQLTRLPKFSNETQESFKFSFANINDTRCYGFLSVPKGRKPPFPAYVTVPGAGPGPSGPSGRTWAAKGALAMVVSVHAYDCGQPVAEIKKCYAALNKTGLYSRQGAPDREAYYFRRAILGMDRAVNYLASRPDFDGKHLVVDGSSQGGGSTLILAGLNPHVTAAAANVPALCDHAGILAGRSPGWPGILRGKTGEALEPYLKMSAYFDAVNFARRITCPVIVSVGFIDRTCSPSSVYSAYNVIRAPKRIFPDPRAGHQWNVGQYRAFQKEWIPKQLGLGKP